MRAEILAPAGAMEQVTAAVRCGADAVYLGAKGFNARRNASNFDETGLPEAVSYCHARGVKVYVTVNTLVMDSEYRQLQEEAALIAGSGADAVIIQDLAVAELFREHYPSLDRHASTQTAVHNVDGARFLKSLGFSRIVLARECTLEEMRRIRDEVDIKTEAFVHGAHCMSVSGACYLSGMIGGRSGNRGLCAQPCRLDWQCGGSDHVLSLKDMSLIGHIRELEEAGVDSLKIEGRMKRPEYVAAAVTACRKAQAGEEYDADSLRAVFSRSGFTDGYLTGRRDASMFGYRTKEDVIGAEGVLGELRTLYRGERQAIPVDMQFSADADGSRLTVSDGEQSVTVHGDAPQRALNRPTDAESAARNLCKTGGTPFAVRSFAAEIAEGLALPASALNAMRRNALDRLLAERGKLHAHPYRAVSLSEPGRRSYPGGSEYWARFSSAEQIPEGDRFAKILLPVSAVTDELLSRFGDRLIAELPAVLFPTDEKSLERELSDLCGAGLRAVMTDNIYGIPLAQRLGLKVYGGMGLNILNTRALCAYEAAGLSAATVSFELAMSRCRTLGGTLPRGITVYGRLPLMRWRNCPLRATIGCKNCGESGSITDRLGIRFPVECSDKRFSTLLNSVPLHIAERDIPAFDFLLFYFTRETRKECERIAEDYRAHRRYDGEKTGGLYYRTLQ